ncbi:MAG: tetratricopeptide repeat protein [Candidatus Megaira endosymbiont of Carteria cerasiformis]|nr:tetratricopeptide repeat protein [Candidatus Megaera polyxenophila]MCC8461490.1 tetratricopeptide repeat protein [Candidatus Megaera polyxenophila]
MKRDDEKGKEKEVSAKTLQAMPPNVLATRYLREANNKVIAEKYEESAVLYKQAIDYFEIAIHGGVSISKSNYTNAIYNWVTTLYYNRKYEEALEALNTYIILRDVQYIDLSILLHTQKDLCYNLALVYIAKKDFPNALKNLSTSNALGQSVVALYNMGYVENLQKHFKEAHDYYDQALQLAIKSSKNTLLIDKAIKNNITEYFIELCHTSDPMDEFESLVGRKNTYQMIYEQLPDSCLKHAKYLLSQSIPVTNAWKSITDVNTAVLMFNRLAKLYSQVTEEASQELLSIKLQISHDYWDLLNTYSYIKTKQCLPSYEVDESLDDSSTILGSRVELLEESFSEKPSIKKLLKELTDTRPCELILEYLSSDYDTIVNLTLEYLGEEDICAQMAGLIQEKLSLESEI